jgi:hypothetical protein
MQTLSFAKQRFDSCASPQAMYVMLLVPIAMLLASQAADDRKDAKTRRRCLEALARMTPEQRMLAGLSAALFLQRFCVSCGSTMCATTTLLAQRGKNLS